MTLKAQQLSEMQQRGKEFELWKGREVSRGTTSRCQNGNSSAAWQLGRGAFIAESVDSTPDVELRLQARV